jgi:adenylosuccinate synthase
MTEYDELPGEFRSFVALLEHLLQIPIKAISTGPERHQMIVRSDRHIHNLDWMDGIREVETAA